MDDDAVNDGDEGRKYKTGKEAGAHGLCIGGSEGGTQCGDRAAGGENG